MPANRSILYPLISGCLIASGAWADDAPNYRDETLTGDWNGARTSLYESGIDIEAIYKFDIIGNAGGGIKEGVRGLDNLDLMVHFDGEKLFGSKGTSALIHFLNNNGGHPDRDLVGSAQGFENIEIPDSSARLYQAWAQQNFFDDRVSLLAGIFDINYEFNVTDSSLLFVHYGYSMDSTLALSGVMGPATYPFGALGARAKFVPVENSYVQIAVTDGIPGDPTNPRGTQIELNNGDGAMVIAEAGFIPGGSKPNGKLAVGGWYYTNEFPDHVDPAREERSEGYYLMAERTIHQESGSDTQGLAVFARLGFADGDVNRFDNAWAAGLVYTGLIPGRDEGQLGFGANSVHSSGKYREAAVLAASPVDSAESQLELTYSDNITPWLTVQPDFQYIINPGTDPAIDNAWVVGTRFTVLF